MKSFLEKFESLVEYGFFWELGVGKGILGWVFVWGKVW